MAGIADVRHPQYDEHVEEWEKFRLTYSGGRPFIDEYLEKYSARETAAEFTSRKKITYCPAHSKATINDIKNSIYQRLVDITRAGGSPIYTAAVDGSDPAGVDFAGNSMKSYMGNEVLPDLLSIGKIGIYVDKDDVEITTRIDDLAVRPYLYTYAAEDILSWRYNINNELMSVLLRDTVEELDEESQLPKGTTERFRLYNKTENGVTCQLYTADGSEDGALITLNMPNIPIVILDLTTSLLTDVADIQIALLNMASSDIHYAIKGNYPFYTEQFDPRSENTNMLSQAAANSSADGTSASANTSKPREIVVGVSRGRRYPNGMERPGFINPSPEPLRVSMEKQKEMKAEIRQLVNVNLASLETNSSSAESKAYDDSRGLESGLSYIGLRLEFAEREIAKFWAAYGNEDVATVIYPQKYSLRTEAESLKEAEELEKNASMSPSLTYKKSVAKRVIELRIGTKVSHQELQTIFDEVDAADYIVTDSGLLNQDITDGLVSPQTASLIRGYASDEYIAAQEAQARRLAIMSIAQSKDGGAGAARGVNDLDVTGKDGEEEKRGLKELKENG